MIHVGCKTLNLKKTKYKLFWIRSDKDLQEGIFLAEIWIDKTRVKDRMITMKVKIQSVISSIISDYVPQCGLDDNQI